MKFIVVLATVFSVCYCYSDLNILPFETTGQKFHPLKRPLLNSLLTDEEILKCRYFLDNIGEYHNQRSSQEELEDKLSKCDLLLQKSTKLSAKKDDNNVDRSPSFKSVNSQDNELTVIVDSTTRSSEEVNSKNSNEKNEILSGIPDRNENGIYSKLSSGLYENLKEVSIETTFQATTESSDLRNLFLVNREQNEANSTDKQPDKLEHQKTETDTVILSPIKTNWSLWSILFGTSESSGNSSSVLVAEQNEKQSDKSEDQNTQSGIIILSPINTGWRFWSFFSGASDQNEKQSDKPGDQNAQSDIANLSPINTGWSFWSFFSGASEKNEKQSYKSKNQKMESGIEFLSPISPVWNLWSLLSGARDSSDSSKENRSEKFFERNKTAESGINFENSMYLEFTTTEAGVWNLIMPGTKWCGSGSIATHDDDLGYFADVDRCCRAHDKCDDLMMPGESKYNLTNTSPFTVLNCKCDDELYDCLSKINSVASNTVGNTFFNIFARMCYTLDYRRKCKRYSRLYLGCLEYEIDKTAEKVYQWKPAKKYLKMPFVISR
ncbi:uncharacterized protein LOC129964145 isoform X2 [Argiope bruennichi]|uniref:uncharacterized protein LOC129964145 isoform X2 n=1 Tax=Argiope bruennichi TaxID=94029 RepID=UPI0024941BB9|nr:uncharacterized protein LOC129964145 isoform X2 [Argiope bruennichi]